MNPADLENFSSTFPELVEDVISYLSSLDTPDPALERVRKCLSITTRGGKRNRANYLLRTAVIIAERPLTSVQLHEINILGWVIELFQAAYLVNDDIMDNSLTRRGQSCWYRWEGVGLTAINDANLIISCLRYILKKHFREHPAYVDIVNLMDEAALHTEIGQLTDLIVASHKLTHPLFSRESVFFIATKKTAYYSFYLPVAIALHYFKMGTSENLQKAQKILLTMGCLFQAQDDYLDVFGDPFATGKHGSDISDNKCSWLIVEALSRCTGDQRSVLERHYGKEDQNSMNQVKTVLEDLEIKMVYEEYEDEACRILEGMIATVNEGTGLRKKVFTELLSTIYRRSD